jgi:hypothetical protein
MRRKEWGNHGRVHPSERLYYIIEHYGVKIKNCDMEMSLTISQNIHNMFFQRLKELNQLLIQSTSLITTHLRQLLTSTPLKSSTTSLKYFSMWKNTWAR